MASSNRRWRVALTIAAAAAMSCAPLNTPRADGPELPSKRGRDRLDVDYARDIANNTTDPAYLTEWVDHLPESRRVRSPKQFLGYSIGTPGKLTKPETVNGYFRALERDSNRVQVQSMGQSHGGREMIVAAIGSPKNLRRLEEIKARNHELADPRVTSEERAKEIADETPVVYWMTAGLHSPETGSPEMVMELAYRLAVSEQDHIREIRDNVVVLITPVLEMDGRARMVDWYERHLTGVEDFADSPPRMAPYWGDYTAHDNNRDGLQLSQPLTRNYNNTFHEFLPALTLDLHESVPLLYVSTGTGPYNESIDPITVTEWQWIAGYEVSTATKMGLQGVWTWGFYTGWYPGYLLWVSNNHNATGRFYETFGNSNPKTFERELDRDTYAGKRLNSRQWYRAWPPEKKVQWSLRNNTNYMQTGVLASLQLAARHREEILFNFWKKGRNGVEAGAAKRPHAFVIPHEQRDDGALHRLLSLLADHRIEVSRATAKGTFRAPQGKDPVVVEAGDYVVRMDQPYRNFAKTLLLAQPFPTSSEITPYDDVAWSLDYMLGVTVDPIDDPAVLTLAMDDLEATPDLPGTVQGAGPLYLVEHQGQGSLASLVFALPDAAKVSALGKAWKEHPAGSLVIEGVAKADLEGVIGPLHLAAQTVAAPPAADLVGVQPARIGLFHTWSYTQDSGWARHTLESLGIPYTLIDKDDVRAGDLDDRFDVIVVPSQGGSRFADIVQGIDDRWSPLAYEPTDGYASHGVIDASPDITGGMGFSGVAQLEAFVREGGVLVGLGSGGVVASEGGFARDVATKRPGGTPGSHVTTKMVRPEHPLVWGYDEVDWVFRGNLPLYDVRDWDRGRIVMQFGTKTEAEARKEADAKADIATPPQLSDVEGEGEGDSEADDAKKGGATKAPLVRSGKVDKPKVLDHEPALLDVPVGKGRVVLFGWNPLHRHQNEHDFGYFTNALLFFDDFPAVPSRDEMRARDESAQH